MQRKFQCPIYSWKALEPFWASIALGISKIFVYHRFSSDCYKDHKLWRVKKQGLEALRFADLMSRDRGVKYAISEFNRQVSSLRYGSWLQAFHEDTEHFFAQLTQFGQMIYNSVHFLRKTGYLVSHRIPLGVNTLRPYWAPIRQETLMKEWLLQTCEFILTFLRKYRRYPAFRDIAGTWQVPRYTLVNAGLTREIIFAVYKQWRETGKITFVKPIREYELLTEKEQEEVAKNIVGRVYY